MPNPTYTSSLMALKRKEQLGGGAALLNQQKIAGQQFQQSQVPFLSQKKQTPYVPWVNPKHKTPGLTPGVGAPIPKNWTASTQEELDIWKRDIGKRTDVPIFTMDWLKDYEKERSSRVKRATKPQKYYWDTGTYYEKRYKQQVNVYNKMLTAPNPMMGKGDYEFVPRSDDEAAVYDQFIKNRENELNSQYRQVKKREKKYIDYKENYAKKQAKRNSGCIIVTACTGRNSYEANLSRKYRDTFLSAETTSGYYILASKVVPLLRNNFIRCFTKKVLVDRLVDYGEVALNKKKVCKYRTSNLITSLFLFTCTTIGRKHDKAILTNT